MAEEQVCPFRLDSQTLEEATAEGSNENEIENGTNEPDKDSTRSNPTEHKGPISIIPKREQATPFTFHLSRAKSLSLTAEIALVP